MGAVEQAHRFPRCGQASRLVGGTGRSPWHPPLQKVTYILHIMATKAKTKKRVMWSVFRISGSMSVEIGTVFAATETEALKIAFRQLPIGEGTT
jgi:hypothetical protein